MADISALLFKTDLSDLSTESNSQRKDNETGQSLIGQDLVYAVSFRTVRTPKRTPNINLFPLSHKNLKQ